MGLAERRPVRTCQPNRCWRRQVARRLDQADPAPASQTRSISRRRGVSHPALPIWWLQRINAGRGRWAEPPDRPRLGYVPGASDAPVSLCVSACARTRRAWRCSSSFASAAQPARADRAALPEAHRLSNRPRRPATARSQKKGQKNVGRPQHHPKSDVVVAIVRLIPVAVRTARVVRVVVPRAPAHHLPRPPDQTEVW